MVNNFKIKAAEMNILGELFETLEQKEKSLSQIYKRTGEQVQSKNWRTDELLWEDEEQTIPKMENVYDYFNKEENEYSDEDIAELKAIKSLKAKLEKLV